MMNAMTRRSERGGARLKFLIVVAILGALAYAGYQILPIFYQDFQIKDLMQHDVDTAVALGKPATWVKEQLVKSSPEYGIPADAVITPTQQDNRLEVRVQFTQPIDFVVFSYNHEFDYTAKSTTFITTK